MQAFESLRTLIMHASWINNGSNVLDSKLYSFSNDIDRIINDLSRESYEEELGFGVVQVLHD